MANNFVVHDKDSFEDRLIEFATSLVARLRIQLFRSCEDLKALVDEVGPRGEVVVDVIQLGLEGETRSLDLAQLGMYFRLCDLAIRRQVNEILFFDPEGFDLLLKLTAKQSLRVRCILEGSVHARANGLDELGLESNGAVVLQDCPFDFDLTCVAGVACAFLLAATEEVEVCFPVAPNWSLHDHAAIYDLVLAVALPAPEAALQVVVVYASRIARSRRGMHSSGLLRAFGCALISPDRSAAA